MKLPCPSCKSKQDSVVIETRANGEYIRRRRVCKPCGHRFTTIEIPAEVYNKSVKG